MGCGFVCGIISRFMSTTRWSAWLVGHIVIRRYGRNSIVVEFGQQFAFGVALCLAITAVFFLSVEHFVPFVIECIMCGFKPLLLLLQAPRSGDKSLLEAFLFHLFFRDDECIVIQTVLPFGDRLISGVFGISVIRERPQNVVAVPIFLGVVRGIIFSCAGITIFTVAWFGSASPMSLLRLLLRRLILNCMLFFLVIAFFGGIHHVNVI